MWNSSIYDAVVRTGLSRIVVERMGILMHSIAICENYNTLKYSTERAYNNIVPN